MRDDRSARDALVNDATLVVNTLHHAGDPDGGQWDAKAERAGQALALLALVAG